MLSITSIFSTAPIEFRPYEGCTGWTPKNELVAHAHPVDFTISVKQTNLDVLRKTALDVSTPGHPSYGQYLTVKQIAELTAPKPEHMSTVVAWLKESGVSFEQKRELLLVKTTVNEASRLLDTSFATYTTGERSLVRASAYSLPDRVAGAVASVLGLHGLPLPERAPLISSGDPPGTAVAVTPKVIAGATYHTKAYHTIA